MSAALVRLNGLTLLPFAPAQLGLWTAAPVAGRDTTPSVAAQALAAGGVEAVLNGPMFGDCGSGGYAATQCERLDFLHRDLARSLNVASSRPYEGATIGVAGDRAQAWRGAPALGPEVRVAVQGYPTLVFDGVAQPVSDGGSNLETVWRSALVLLADGRLAFAIGRMPLAAFAAALAAVGAVAAVYTDGGGSTALQVAGDSRQGSSENRRVPSWLVVRAAGAGAAGPDADGKGNVAGAAGWVVGGVAAALTTLMLWWVTKE